MENQTNATSAHEPNVINDDRDHPNQHQWHRCDDFRTTIYHISKQYTYDSCGVCDRITKFRWKSFWKRLSELL